MRYLVDEALCCGRAQCALVAPEVYTLDAEGINVGVGTFTEVPPGLEDAAEEGALTCPEAAIRIFD